jgi:hypothetical protein
MFKTPDSLLKLRRDKLSKLSNAVQVPSLREYGYPRPLEAVTGRHGINPPAPANSSTRDILWVYEARKRLRTIAMIKPLAKAR